MSGKRPSRSVDSGSSAAYLDAQKQGRLDGMWAKYMMGMREKVFGAGTEARVGSQLDTSTAILAGGSADFRNVRPVYMRQATKRTRVGKRAKLDFKNYTYLAVGGVDDQGFNPKRRRSASFHRGMKGLAKKYQKYAGLIEVNFPSVDKGRLDAAIGVLAGVRSLRDARVKVALADFDEGEVYGKTGAYNVLWALKRALSGIDPRSLRNLNVRKSAGVRPLAIRLELGKKLSKVVSATVGKEAVVVKKAPVKRRRVAARRNIVSADDPSVRASRAQELLPDGSMKKQERALWFAMRSVGFVKGSLNGVKPVPGKEGVYKGKIVRAFRLKKGRTIIHRSVVGNLVVRIKDRKVSGSVNSKAIASTGALDFADKIRKELKKKARARGFKVGYGDVPGGNHDA
jgi:hypothetical protein